MVSGTIQAESDRGLRAWAFTGQGFPYVGMGREMAATAAGESVFSVASGVLETTDTINFMMHGPKEALSETRHAQLATFMFAAASLHHSGVEVDDSGLVIPSADYVLGHSLGELTALYAAGVMTLEQALSLVEARGMIMERLIGRQRAAGRSYGMLALLGVDQPLELEEIQSFCQNKGIADIANYNSPREVVLGGDRSALEALEFSAGIQLGVKKASLLSVPTAFHTPKMSEANADFYKHLATVGLQRPRVPVIFNMLGDTGSDTPESLRSLLSSQISSPVNWMQSIRSLRRLGVAHADVFGPGAKQVGRMITDTCSEITVTDHSKIFKSALSKESTE